MPYKKYKKYLKGHLSKPRTSIFRHKSTNKSLINLEPTLHFVNDTEHIELSSASSSAMYVW
jgi:hypothetical protein